MDCAGVPDDTEEAAQKYQLTEESCERCLQNLYHNFSKPMHESGETVTIASREVTAEVERAVLVAVFQYGGIVHLVLDEFGTPDLDYATVPRDT